MSAARGLLAEGGWATASLRAICARAKLADRYFYESYRDRDALLTALVDEITQEIVAAVAPRVLVAPANVAARSRAAIEAALDVIEANPGLIRVLFFETPDSRAVYQHRRAAMRRFAEYVATEGAAMAEGDRPSLTDLRLTAHALLGAFNELLIVRDEGELALTRDELAARMQSLVLAALPTLRTLVARSRNT